MVSAYAAVAEPHLNALPTAFPCRPMHEKTGVMTPVFFGASGSVLLDEVAGGGVFLSWSALP
jgi:hypothetical protein